MHHSRRRILGTGRVTSWRSVKIEGVRVTELAGRCEVAALRDAAAVHGDQPGRERGHVRVGRAVGAGEHGLQVPVPGGAERDPLPLPGHHEAGGHGLDPPGGQPGHDLLPQHRGDLVAVQPVQHPPGLVGVHQAAVQLARVVHGVRDGFRGDLVEDHPAGRDLGLQFLQQVPGDGLALAVLISGEEQFVGVLEQRLELSDLGLLVRVHDIESLETVVHVNAEPGPRLLAVLRRDLGRPVRHIPDVPDAGLDDVSLAQVSRDGARLGRGLDNNQAASTAVGRGPVLPRHALGGGRSPCCHAFTF